MSLKLRPVRAEVLQTRVCAKELEAIKKGAVKYCGGNVSEWLRYAAIQYAPLTREQTDSKIKKRK